MNYGGDLNARLVRFYGPKPFDGWMYGIQAVSNDDSLKAEVLDLLA